MRSPLSFRLIWLLCRGAFWLAKATILTAGFALVIGLIAEPIVPEPKKPNAERSNENLFNASELIKDRSLSSFDATLRISLTTFQKFVDIVSGSQVVGNSSVLRAIGLNAILGNSQASIDFSGISITSPVDIRLSNLVIFPLEAQLSIFYLGTKYTTNERSPNTESEIEFEVTFEKLRIRSAWWETLSSWFPKLASHAEIAFAKASFRSVSIPVSIPAEVVVDLGVDEEEVVEFYKILEKRPDGEPKQIAGTVTLHQKIPSNPVSVFLDYKRPLFSPDGIWLVATATESKPIGSRLPPAGSPITARQQVEAAYRVASTGFPIDGDIALWVKHEALLRLANGVASLPSEARTLTVRSINKTGNLGELALTDKNLGELSLKGELPGNKSWSGSAQFKLSGQKTKGEILLAANVEAQLSAEVRLTLEAPIGPPISVDPLITGNGHATTTAVVKVFTEEVDGVESAYIGLDLACTVAKVNLESSGAKFGVLPITFAKVEVALSLPILQEGLRPSLLVDGLPRRIALEVERPKQSEWAVFKPSSPGLDMTFHLRETQTVFDGVLISGDVKFAKANDANLSNPEKASRAQKLRKLRDVKLPGRALPCPKPEPVRVSIAGFTSDTAKAVVETILQSLKSEEEKLKALRELSKGNLKGASEHLKNAVDAKLKSLEQAGKAGQQLLKDAEQKAKDIIKDPLNPPLPVTVIPVPIIRVLPKIKF